MISAMRKVINIYYWALGNSVNEFIINFHISHRCFPQCLSHRSDSTTYSIMIRTCDYNGLIVHTEDLLISVGCHTSRIGISCMRGDYSIYFTVLMSRSDCTWAEIPV